MDTIKSPRAEDDKSRNQLGLVSLENSEYKSSEKHYTTDFVVGRKSSVGGKSEMFPRGSKMRQSDDLTSVHNQPAS
jgi:hypothetical protein